MKIVGCGDPNFKKELEHLIAKNECVIDLINELVFEKENFFLEVKVLKKQKRNDAIISNQLGLDF